MDGTRAWYCVALRHTSPKDHITSGDALNLPDPDEPSSGDWHCGGWHPSSEMRSRPRQPKSIERSTAPIARSIRQ